MGTTKNEILKGKIEIVDSLKAGEYTGVIMDTKIRDSDSSEYCFLDIEIKTIDGRFAGTAYSVSLNHPTTDTSMVGKMLMRFSAANVKLFCDGNMEIAHLVGMKCKFTIVENIGKDGYTYLNVDRNSLSPV